jgi:hypothetical protein
VVPQKAAERPQRLAAPGYDDALLTRANDSEPDVPEDDLAQMRAVVPRRDDPEALCGGRQTQLAWREPQALAELVGQTAPNQPCHV